MSFTLPFCRSEITYEQGSAGQLTAIHLAGRTYLQCRDEWLIFDDGWLRYRERRLGRSLYRQVQALPASWLETYVGDAQGRPIMVDGTRITYDSNGYIAACSDHDQRWNYRYENHQLVAIDGPAIQRTLAYSETQRLRAVESKGRSSFFDYDDLSQRSDTPPPSQTWHRDLLGRLWTVTDGNHQVIYTYLWWGFSCLGRIDGPAGDPLACVFSLDATGTPVRATSRTSSKRFTRDAFGENLLADSSIPGLFGAAQDGRFFHYQARVLDPRTGSFTAPDPYDGSAKDPRRHRGFQGPIPVEQPPAGPYCVCQHDPVGRTDPTGTMSAGVTTFFSTLSTLTWGFQNNIAGMQLGLWNFVLSLLSFNGSVLKKLGDVEGMSSSYSGGWAVRAHPSGLELLGINRRRAWVVQNLIWARGEDFNAHSGARVFVPGKTYEPSLYGSLLWVQPKHGSQPQHAGIDFVLCGNRSNGAAIDQVYGFAPSWTRTGGIGTPVFPGSVIPRFPQGGLHFNYRHLVHAPVEATIAEILPDGEIYNGRLIARQTIEVDDIKQVPAKGTLLITIDGERTLFHTVRGSYSQLGQTRIVTEASKPLAEHFAAALYKVTLAAKHEQLPQGSSIRHLKADQAHSKIRYRPQQLLRLEGGTPLEIGAGKIKSLEAKLTIDANPPGTSGSSPFTIHRIEPLPNKPGKVTISSVRDIEFEKNKPKPEVDDFIVLTIGSFRAVHQVKAGSSAEKMKTERDMFSVLTTAAKVDWYPATRLVKLGEWNGVINGTTLEYEPSESGLAPKDGAILITNGDGAKLGGRNVFGLIADELQFHEDLPGGHVGHKATLMSKGEQVDSDVVVAVQTALKVEEPAARLATLGSSPALELLQLSDTEMTQASSTPFTQGNTVLLDQPWDGSVITITRFLNADFPLSLFSTYAPMPGQFLVVRERGTAHIHRAVVDRLKLSVTFDRTPDLPAATFATGTPLEMILLTEKDLYFKASHVHASRLVLQPQAYVMASTKTFETGTPGIRSETVWLPRFRQGQFVCVIWRKGTVQNDDIYRVKKVSSAALELVGGPAIPAGQDHYAVCQVDAQDPFNGGYRAGTKGKRLGPQKFQFDVWRPNGLTETSYVLTDGKNSAPVRISNIDQLQISFKTTLPLAAGKKVDLVIPKMADLPLHTAHHQILEDEWFFPRFHSFPSPNRMIIKAFSQPKASELLAGNLSTGTNLVPHDVSDKVELDTREAFETHELQHTIQAQTQGPVFFSLIPHFLFDTIALATGEGLETAEFSAFVDGTLETANGTRRLRIANPGTIAFAPGRKVQLVQNATTVTRELGTLANGAFRLSGTINLTDGQVAVRMERKPETASLALAHSWLELFSLGGIQSALMGPLMNMGPWAIAQIVHACNKDPLGRFTQPTMFAATVPDNNNPFVIQVPPKDGNPHGFQIHDRLEMEAGDVRDHAQVVAVNGNDVSLDKPARFTGNNRSLNVGKIGESHPMKSVTDEVANVFGTQELRWLFDPLGQLFYETDPNDKGSLDWTLSILRPFYSTTSWSGFGLFGGFWLDIAYTTLFGESYYSFMEQSASEISGHLYSPIGRLRGDVEYVGDLGRYYHYYHVGLGDRRNLSFTRLNDFELEFDPTTLATSRISVPELDFHVGQEVQVWWETGDDRFKQLFEIVSIRKTFSTPPKVKVKVTTVPGLDSLGGIPAGHNHYFIYSQHHRNYERAALMEPKMGDGPGTNLMNFLRVLPFRTAPGTMGSEPNLSAQSAPNASQALPHHLFAKSTTHPLKVSGGSPLGFYPNPLGSIPISPALERTGGMYVAFSQPSTDPHRLTTINDFPTSDRAKKARIAHNVCLTTRQTMIYDKQIKDVSITFLNQAVTNELSLVFCQKAVLKVAPEKGRIYGLTVADPQNDSVARSPSAMTVLAQTNQGETMVEVSRQFDGQSPPTHLNLPFAVPIRQIKIKVNENLALQEGATHNSTTLNRDVKPGERFFLLIPAKPSVTDLKTIENQAYIVTPVGDRLAPTITVGPLPKGNLAAETKQFLGAGRAYEVSFHAEEVPEDPIQITWNIPVEAGQKTKPKIMKATLKCTAKLVPHFRLESSPAPGTFSVAQAPNQTLILKTDPQTVELADAVVIQAKDKTLSNPQEMFDLKVSDSGKTLEVKTNDKTVKGIFHLLLQDKANSSQRARRTFRVI